MCTIMFMCSLVQQYVSALEVFTHFSLSSI
nr:MAG TPA: hypothetical protein [Caudoviricetes sp.]